MHIISDGGENELTKMNRAPTLLACKLKNEVSKALFHSLVAQVINEFLHVRHASPQSNHLAFRLLSRMQAIAVPRRF